MMNALLLACPDWLEGIVASLSSLSSSSLIMDAEHYEQAQVLLETCIHQLQHFLANQLYLPTYHVYGTAARAALYDSQRAATSVAYWIFLTCRPVILCLYWLTYYFIYHIIYKLVLMQGIYHHGLSQGKELLWMAWRWQCRLTQQQWMMEAAGIVLLYALYKLQQFLKRRRYLYKLHLYVDRKKRRVVKSYHSLVQRLANISLRLAVMTPHALFLATAVGVKCLMPRWCLTLVHSRGVRDILSWWYPLICTLLLLLDSSSSAAVGAADNDDDDSPQAGVEKTRNDGAAATANVMDKENSAPKSSSRKEKTSSSSSRATTLTPESRKRPLTKNSSTFSPFPRTTPTSTNGGRNKTPNSLSSPRWKRSTHTPSSSTTLYHTRDSQQRPRRRRQSLATPLRILSQQQQQQQHFLSPTITAGNNNNNNIDNQQQQQQASLQLQQEEHEADWLRFWIVRGAVQAAKVWLAWWTPLWLHSTLFHLEVLFYLWIYIMPYLQPESISTNGKKYYELPEGRPLQVLHDVYVQPAVEFMHDTISGAVPRDAWETYVVANVRRVLSALVLVWMLSQETADAILHGVQEGRSLVVPAVTLFMPYFITAYGVTYVQYGLSMQKSSLAITMTTIQQSQQQQQHGNDNSKSSSSSSSSCQRWLSYWVLHCALVAILSRLQGLLWWIPFSTHAIFVVWCALSIPRNVDYVFHHLVCDELRAFGILPPTYNYNSNNGSSSGIGSNDNSDDKNDAVVVAAWQKTKTAKCLQWIWERLPKANNSNENDADDYYQQQQDDLFASFSNSTSNDNHDDDDDGDTPMQGDEDGNAAPDSQETPLGAESEQDGDDDDVMDTNELNDDDYVPPTSSSCSTRRHVGVTGVAAAAEASSSSLTSSSVDVTVRPRSTRAVRQSRRNNL